MSSPSRYTFDAVVAAPLETVRTEVESALKEQGFGILTEIDVRATLKEKLGVEREPYLILGACNPHLAHRALQADPSVGALLPCNVVLQTTGDQTRVEIVDPMAALDIVGGDGLTAIAAEARLRLRAVMATIKRNYEGAR